MKKLAFIPLIIMLFMGSCVSNTKTALTDEQKAAISKEIQQLWELSGAGISERNAEKAFSVFSKMEGTKYIRDGHLYPAIDTAKNQYAKWFSSPDSYEQKITCDPMIYDILDENTVLMTTIGYIERVEKTDPDQKPWKIAYTMLWRKEAEGWKLFHMHNSWE